MRESHPLYVEGSLSWLLAPVEPPVAQTDAANSPSLSANRSESALSQTLLNQGASLSRITSSVEELHDTMSDLKQSFKALRLELNTTTPSNRSQDYHGDEAMEMLKTVLKELQSKSDDIEKLKLENDSLKWRNKCLQGHQASAIPVTPRLLPDHSIPQVQSPGFLTEGGPRDLAVAATQMPVADSFDEDNEIMDDEANQSSLTHVKVPLKPAADNPPGCSPQVAQQEQGLSPGFQQSKSRRDSGEPATKRLRLTMTEEQESLNSAGGVSLSEPVKERKRGRPLGARKSQKALPPDEPRTPSTEQASSNTTVPGVVDTTTEETQPKSADASENTRPRGRRRRARSKVSPSGSTSQTTSRAPSTASRVTRRARKSQEGSKPRQKLTLQNGVPARPAGFEVAVNVAELTPESVVNENDPFKQKADQNPWRESDNESEEYQAKVAARDLLAKTAMEREEAMADDIIR
jgi:hypothetical protein